MKTGLGRVTPGDRLFRKDMREDPYAVYGELREQDPVHWDDVLKAWAVTRHDDVAMVLNERDPSRALTYRENPNLRCLEELVLRVSESRLR